MPGHLPGTIPRSLQKLPVNQAHKLQIQRSLAGALVVVGRPFYREQPALPGNAQALVVPGFDQAFPPGVAQRPKALAKKSRSTVNCPILACSSLIWASLAAPARSALPKRSRPCSRWLGASRYNHILVHTVSGRQFDKVCSPLIASSNLALNFRIPGSFRLAHR